MRCYSLLAITFCAPLAACGQQPPPPAQQIALAVLALPKPLRDGATVLGYNGKWQLVSLRKGSGVMTCLADDPRQETFHVACYQNSMEPFMLRGRELRAQGVTGSQVDSIRFADVAAGKVTLPKQAAALWQLFGPRSAVDVQAGTITSKVKPMYVVYMPFATAATTGLSDQPIPSGPWLMDAGTPKAHIMFQPSMEP